MNGMIRVKPMWNSDSGGIFKRGVSPEGLASCHGNGAIAETRDFDDAIRTLSACIHRTGRSS
jgi:hypothetical protein